jgi:nitroreductase
VTHAILNQVLDLARWAPSGDNTQPWRFEIVDGDRFVIHGHDTREHCVYDLDGRPSQISLGALIETAAIAASAHGLALDASLRAGGVESRPTFDVGLTPQPGLTADPLITAIPQRCVQRRALSTRALTDTEQRQLEAAGAPDHEIIWLAGWANRLSWARLLWANAGLRLTLPEAFETHRSVIQWNARYSDDRIPDQALGVDVLTRALMRHAMQSRERVEFLNAYLGGTILPRLQMDLLPALACAAHVAIIARQPLRDTAAYVAGGRMVQRFWLTASRLGLQHQPELTPLIFSRYVREGRQFSATPKLQDVALRLASRLDSMLGKDAARRAVWLGRIGHGPRAVSRSERLPLKDLIQTRADGSGASN